MDKEKIEDCVKFKYELYEKSWAKSGAKNIDEYVKYVSENIKNSTLWIKLKKDNSE